MAGAGFSRLELRPSVVGTALARWRKLPLVGVVGDGQSGGRVRSAHFPNRFLPLEHAATGSAATMRLLPGQVSARKLPRLRVRSRLLHGGGLPRRYSLGEHRLVGRSPDRGSIVFIARVKFCAFGASPVSDAVRAYGLWFRAGTCVRSVLHCAARLEATELSVGGE